MPHPVDVHVGKQIRALRHLNGVTQQQLAEAVGIKFQQIQKYETGFNRVSASRLHDIAKVLGVTVVTFFPESAGGDEQIGSLTSDELKLIRSFRRLTDVLKKQVLGLVAAME